MDCIPLSILNLVKPKKKPLQMWKSSQLNVPSQSQCKAGVVNPPKCPSKIMNAPLPTVGNLRKCHTCENLVTKKLLTSEILEPSASSSHRRDFALLSSSPKRRNSLTGGGQLFGRDIPLKDVEEMDEVGQGAFGRVVKVRLRHRQKVFVMKEILDPTSADSMESVVKELLTLRALKHHNVLHCVGVVLKSHCLCPIFEFIDGGPLHDVIIDLQRPLPWPLRCQYLRDIAAAMEYLHRNCIIHRDLNSPNCLVRKASNSVVVADLGLCIHLPKDDLVSNKLRKIRRLPVAGSPFGMAPEMLAGLEYTELVDVYSFGVIICELMTRLSFSPDHLPRDSVTMVMDMAAVNQLKDAHCPEDIFQLAFSCCSLHPSSRPAFSKCHSWLNSLTFHLQTGTTIPSSLAQLFH